MTPTPWCPNPSHPNPDHWANPTPTDDNDHGQNEREAARRALEEDMSRLEKHREDAEKRAAGFETEMASLRKGLEEAEATARQAALERDRQIKPLTHCCVMPHPTVGVF